MSQSESEGFESADEGASDIVRKERHHRKSSSNYSDSTTENQKEIVKNAEKNTSSKETSNKAADGWDDFDLEDDDNIVQNNPLPSSNVVKPVKQNAPQDTSENTGWDDFDDWGQDDVVQSKMEPSKQQSPDMKSVADRLAASSVKKEGDSWGWGTWGMDSLLSSATAGISSITTHVSQGISTVLESGIGAPDPEELARQKAMSKESMVRQEDNKQTSTEEPRPNDDAAFDFGSLLSGVTKFVEDTGTKVLAGGLDTLETIGKKTMEVLQDGDPGLAKKRAMLGLDSGEKVVLSQVLREAKEKADQEDKIRDEKRETKEVHYETLFDDFEGLVHLEALEMLCTQVNMRIEERLRNVDAEKRKEIKETLQQVAELCEVPEDSEDEDDSETEGSMGDVFHDKLLEATQDLGLKLQFQPLVKHYTTTTEYLETNADDTEKAIYKLAVSSLAQFTALAVELYHKTAELLLVKQRRSTADEADALALMTSVLCKHTSDLATRFTQKLNSVPSENKENINNYITNVFLEAGNSSTYIRNAFQLSLPILQIGAV